MNNLLDHFGSYKYIVGYHPKFMGIRYTPPEYVFLEVKETEDGQIYKNRIWQYE